MSGPTPSVQFSWDGPGALGAGQDALYLRWNNATGAFEMASAGVSDHGGLTGLGDDDHTQYALLAGRGGGQTLVGGTGSGENLTLRGTSHATPGNVVMANGQLLLASGAVSAPSISFGFDTDTGFRSQSAGDLRAVGNGSDVFQFTAAANTSMRAFGISNTYGFTVAGGLSTFKPLNSAGVVAIFKGAASQSGNYIECNTSAGSGGDIFHITSNGFVRAVDGTAAAPSFSFVSDNNCGLLRFSSDDWGAVVGGVEIMRFTHAAGVQKWSVFGVTPVARPTALTAADAGALNTGDAGSDTVIDNMRTRIGELESKLQALGLLT